jgi:hypothetical protein
LSVWFMPMDETTTRRIGLSFLSWRCLIKGRRTATPREMMSRMGSWRPRRVRLG